MSYLLIGLGNPGEKYKETRHNAGKEFVRWMNTIHDSRFMMHDGLEAVETECFMNSSGDWLKKFMNHKSLIMNHLIIIHDDLDIPLGKFKIQFGKGPRLHNGVLSVEQALGTKEFWRVRIGVNSRGPRDKGQGLRVGGEEYVLEKFRPEEKKVLELVFPEIREKLDSLSFLRKQESIYIDSGSSPE